MDEIAAEVILATTDGDCGVYVLSAEKFSLFNSYITGGYYGPGGYRENRVEHVNPRVLNSERIPDFNFWIGPAGRRVKVHRSGSTLDGWENNNHYGYCRGEVSVVYRGTPLIGIGTPEKDVSFWSDDGQTRLESSGLRIKR